MRLVFIIIAFVSFSTVYGQISRNDLEKMTTKGSTLLDNGRLEDAIEIFNDILTKDPTEGKALLLRARTKLELGAFKGAKKDCFAYMDAYGIDAEVAGLLGKTEKAMENFKQALAYLKTALLFDPVGEEYLLDRASIFYDLGLDDQACADWNTAAENGSTAGSNALKTNCKRYKPEVKETPVREEIRDQAPPREEDYTSNDSSEEEEDYTSNTSSEEENEEDYTSNSSDEGEEEEVEDSTNSNSEDSSNNDPFGEAPSDDEEPVVEEEPEDIEESYPLDDSVEKIFIDDELTIVLADGIGSRKLTEKPDILILSDKSGDVVVNVCIDRLGRVQNPTLNEEYSTINSPSLISLAIRESSNFRFARSSRKSHCGTITYQITGSE